MLLLLLACKPDPEKPLQPTYVDPDGAEWQVLGNGHLRLNGEKEFRLGLGFVDSYDPMRNYDPYHWKDETWAGAVPEGLVLAETVTAEMSEEGWRLGLENGEEALLTVDEKGPGLRIHLTQPEGAEMAPFAFIRTEADAEERYYGLGETFDAVEKRGTIHAMHVVFDSSLESSYNEAHAPVPLLASTKGWGMLVDSDRPGVFDVASTDSALVEAVFEQQGDFWVDLYAPPKPVEVVARYLQRTGAPEVPPTWAFAPLQWRNVVAGQEMVLADAAAIRENGVATGLIWVDNPWQTSYNSMVGDPEQFPQWDDMVKTLHDHGFRFMAWTTPYVEEADPEYQHYADEGWFVDAPVLFSDFGDAVDFTNPDAISAWEGRVADAKERGIEGWKLDYGEDLQIGIGAARTQFGLYSGETERTLHHKWAGLYHSAYAEPYAGSGFLLGRAGGKGSQHVTDCLWPGDLDSDFHQFREDGHVGGLPSAIRGGLSLSASGFPFFASDTGGYRHDRPTHEVMVRWTEFSALLPIMQYGGGGENHNPWDFTDYGTSHFTEETLAIFKRYATLHTRLFPYFYELSLTARDAGIPVVIPAGLAVPDTVMSDTSFLIGTDLFVDPIETEGATEKEVVFPLGNWVHWWSGVAYAGEAKVPAPLGEGPLFQRVGSMIPLLRESVVTLSPSDGSVDSWADTPGRLNARWIPDGNVVMSLSTGEKASGDTEALTLEAGSLYAGWEIEIWKEGIGSVTVDGKALEKGAEGCQDCWVAVEHGITVVISASAGVVSIR